VQVGPVVLEVDAVPAPLPLAPYKSRAGYQRVNRFDETLRDAGSAAWPAQAAAERYTVQQGDNLTGIVQRRLKELGRPASAAEVYDQVRRVARQNGVANVDRLHVGQQLDLSGLGGAQAPAPVTVPRVKVEPPAHTTPKISVPEHPSAAPALVDVKPIATPPAPRRENATPARQTGKAFRPLRREQAPMQLASSKTEQSGRPFVLVPRGMEVDGKGGPAGMALEAYRQPGMLVQTVSAVKRVMHVGQQAKGAGAQEPVAAVEKSPAGTMSPIFKTSARLSSGYGMRRDPFNGKPDFHKGIDLAVAAGTDIYPVQPGVVSFSGWQPGYGRIVVVRHENGLETVYAHNSSNLARAGDTVSPDAPIARVGTSGRSTGPHVHFEVRKEGKPVDPTPYLQSGAWSG
jgi:murein DD-endopeptidase MepM/ murein hydrolase activator NlpD